jgi:protein gp37/ParB-like chromosome segregation protein Spo0J
LDRFEHLPTQPIGGRVEEKVVEQVDPRALKPNPLNLRIYGTEKDEDFEPFKKNVEQNGIRNPLHALDDGTIENGHRRWRAATELGFPKIPVIRVAPADDNEAALMLLDFNVSREKTEEQKAREYGLRVEIETKKATNRKSEAAKQSNRRRAGKTTGDENITSPGNNGAAKDIAAKKSGFSRPTAEKSVRVVHAIDRLEEEGRSEDANDLRETLNTKGSAAAERKARRMTGEGPSGKSTFNSSEEGIEWAKWSWNPVTGCKHGCKYCYAKVDAELHYEDLPKGKRFEPTPRFDRLTAPFNTKVPKEREDEPGIRNVFVCSMADLFGEWVPKDWIDKVLDAVRNATQFNFIFLTKNPKRLSEFTFPDNAWVGATVDEQFRADSTVEAMQSVKAKVRFLSCEPLMEAVSFKGLGGIDWLIIGAQTAQGQCPEYQPPWEHVQTLVDQATQAGVKIYIKKNLTSRPPEQREFPGVA